MEFKIEPILKYVFYIPLPIYVNIILNDQQLHANSTRSQSEMVHNNCSFRVCKTGTYSYNKIECKTFLTLFIYVLNKSINRK